MVITAVAVVIMVVAAVGCPEIDPSLAPTAIALLAGGLVIFKSKIKQK